MKKHGTDATFAVDIKSNDPIVVVRHGVHQDASRVEFIQHSTLYNILEHNNVLKEVKIIMDDVKKHRDSDLEIEKLIYNTLAKYLIQMLNAASATIIYPELRPLEIHKDVYFKDL